MISTASDEVFVRLVVSGIGGLAIGVEREWSIQSRGAVARFAGVRTFFMLGLIAGIAGILSESAVVVSAALIVAVSGLVISAYAIAARQDGLDGTTEVAALLVMAAGFFAGTGQTAGASAIFAVTALALSEKSRIHESIRRAPEPVLKAAFRFAVLALVVLPLLAPGPFGPPPGIHPQRPGFSLSYSRGSASRASSRSTSPHPSSATASSGFSAASCRRPR
ncbi:MAG: MgtC/SapB family protein, partial [Candidatus Binatia bacterium]